MKTETKNENLKKSDSQKKQWKVGVHEETWNALNAFVEKSNLNAKRRIKAPDVLAIAVQKLSDKDIERVQASVYTADDKLSLAWEEHNKTNPERPLTRDQYLAYLLEEVQGRLAKRVPAKGT